MKQRRRRRKTRPKTRKKYKNRRAQSGNFLNRYDFAYAGRDTVNQLGKQAPDIIKDARSESNNNAEQRINQAISQEGKELERVLANTLTGTIEDLYQTPFRLLGKFSKRQLQNLKNKIVR